MPDRIDVIVVEQATQRGIAGVAVTTGDGVATTALLLCLALQRSARRNRFHMQQ